jgi:hypothetical protein
MHGRLILGIVCLVVWLPGLCLGQIEITPFYGYQFGGGFEDEETGKDYDLSGGPCVGGMVDFHVNEISQVEFYYSHQETELEAGRPFPSSSFFDMDVDYYHLGGTLLLSDEQLQPFVVGTLGLTHLSPEPSAFGSLTRFSLGFGGGVRYFPTENLGLYLAGRGLYTFVEGDTHITIESGTSTIRIEANGLWQAVLQAGAIFRF